MRKKVLGFLGVAAICCALNSPVSFAKYTMVSLNNQRSATSAAEALDVKTFSGETYSNSKDDISFTVQESPTGKKYWDVPGYTDHVIKKGKKETKKKVNTDSNLWKVKAKGANGKTASGWGRVND